MNFRKNGSRIVRVVLASGMAIIAISCSVVSQDRSLESGRETPSSRGNRNAEIDVRPAATRPSELVEEIRGVVYFSAGVSQASISQLLGTVNDLAARGCGEVVILINSHGGKVSSTFFAYDTLTHLPIKIVTCNAGQCASAANYIFAAGVERYCAPNATFMFHHNSHTPAGSTKSITNYAEAASRDEERMHAILKKAMPGSSFKTYDFFGSDLYLDRESAAKLKFVTHEGMPDLISSVPPDFIRRIADPQNPVNQ